MISTVRKSSLTWYKVLHWKKTTFNETRCLVKEVNNWWKLCTQYVWYSAWERFNGVSVNSKLDEILVGIYNMKFVVEKFNGNSVRIRWLVLKVVGSPCCQQKKKIKVRSEFYSVLAAWPSGNTRPSPGGGPKFNPHYCGTGYLAWILVMGVCAL